MGRRHPKRGGRNSRGQTGGNRWTPEHGRRLICVVMQSDRFEPSKFSISRGTGHTACFLASMPSPPDTRFGQSFCCVSCVHVPLRLCICALLDLLACPVQEALPDWVKTRNL